MDRVIKQVESDDIGGGLRWCEAFGVAFQEDQSRSVAYDAAYFEKHRSYEGTPINDAVNLARLRMVRTINPSGKVLDVGIGCGTFLNVVELHQVAGGFGVHGGYDVNPSAIEWLRQREWFVDPYRQELPAAPITWTLWDVLEHLPNPHEILDRVRVGDSLCLTVPIFHDLRREVFGSKHYRPDEHYYYFTPAGLIRWMWAYRFQLVESNTAEQSAGRESVASFSFVKVKARTESSCPPPKRAFLVCGPESSGNRLLTSILCRAGCWGSDSTDQPTPAEVPDDQELVALIQHHDLLQAYRTLKAKGFAVTALLLVREWNAHVASLVTRGHDASVTAAEMRIKRTLLDNLSSAMIYNIPLIVTTYESLNDRSIRCLLERLSLSTATLDQPLKLLGQETPSQSYFPTPLAENNKHYGAIS